MATYRNKNDDTIFYGGEFKLKVSMDTIGGYDMRDEGINFTCTFSTGNASVVLRKNQMFPVEGDPKSYIAPLDSTALGRGTLTVKYEVDIPDTDFTDDNFRHEVVEIPTKIKIK
jgi:hypothetical protein